MVADDNDLALHCQQANEKIFEKLCSFFISTEPVDKSVSFYLKNASIPCKNWYF
ncbi:Hypothetical protein AJF4211_001840 [Avibacterium paragallinarum JF4211]|nr:Hypothetical protein AJF4211_001840 [Avibacterium paragallinarum JF4211]